MKDLNKILLTLIFICKGLNSCSQNIGIYGGLNLSDVGSSSTNSVQTGFHFGASTQLLLKNNSFVEISAYFSRKGFRSIETFPYEYGPPEKVKVQLILNYLEHSFCFKQKIIINKCKLHAILGPILAIGLRGKYMYDYTDSGIDEDASVKWDRDNFNRIDCGLKGGFGIEFNTWQIDAAYTYGVLNISNNRNWQNRTLSFSLTKWFGKLE
ncbi:MAG: PorT family protein [Bacteroidetes bacterium]|nr:PorT family protein [Bacteroidota bacterium]